MSLIHQNYFIQFFRLRKQLQKNAFIVSVLFSVLSAMFNLFVMRHGVLLVGAGAETKSLWSDLKRIPLLIYEFVTFLPGTILRFISEGKILAAIGVFSAFGLTVGALLGGFRGKWSWAWTTASERGDLCRLTMFRSVYE